MTSKTDETTQSSPTAADIPDFADLQQRSGTMFKQQAIVNDITGKYLISSLNQDSDEELNPSSLYDRTVEDYFEELNLYCFRMVLMRTQDRALAEDIAQEAIFELLKSHQDLKQVKPWLYKVVLNKLSDHYRDKCRTCEMHARIDAEHKLSQLADSKSMGSSLFFDLLREIPEITKTQEYQDYLELASYPTLKSYAAAKGITYDRAKKLSMRLKHDIRSAYLRMTGWKVSVNILSFQQYTILKNFVATLSGAWTDRAGKEIRKHSSKVSLAKIRETFKDMDSIIDWQLEDLGDGRYVIIVVSVKDDDVPKVCSLRIRFTPKNRIQIDDVKRNELAGILETPPGFEIPTQKGFCALSMEQLEDMIREHSEDEPLIPAPGCEDSEGVDIFIAKRKKK